ncbi:hypothetical protein EMIT0P12_20115 [Pseudomonas sp. IT-P12]
MVRPGHTEGARQQMVLLEGEPSEAFEWFKVDRAVGNVRNQGASEEGADCAILAVFSGESENLD